MKVLRKNLFMFCSALLFSMGTSWCMNEVEKTKFLLQGWLDKKAIVKSYSKKAKRSNKDLDYVVGDKKLATFLSDGNVVFFSGELSDVMPALFVLVYIDESNKKKLREEKTH